MVPAMSRIRSITLENRTGLYSLAMAGCVALVIWLGWRMWQEPPPEPAQQLKFSELTATWKCDNGHVFEAPAAYGSRPCELCDANAYILGRYRCSQHGELEAQLEYERTPGGQDVIAAMRFEGHDWIDHPVELRCPYCGRRLTQILLDVFSAGPKEEGG
jgi:hypothetical protein